MSATFDATTTAAYAAANTAAERSALIVAALTGTISVKVFNGSNTEMGSGTMAAPWATASGATVTVGEVTSFTVGTTATPDADWYIRFQNADVSRWVRGSFGLSSSSQDFTWSLGTWTATHTGTIGTATIIASGNSAPAFTVAPTTASISDAGGTIQFTATDPEGGAIFYSLTTTRSGITIDSTGLVTVTGAAAGTSGDIVVQASDGILTASATCGVTVRSALEIKFNPGHYVLVEMWSGEFDTQAERFAFYDTIAAESSIEGILLRSYHWSDFEGATAGDYSAGFILLDAEIAKLRSIGKRLILSILPNAFTVFTSDPATYFPAYMQAAPYGLIRHATGWTFARWREADMGRFIALMDAYGNRYDSNPAFEMVLAGAETTIGFNTTYPAPSDWTADNELTQHLRLFTAMRESWPTTLVMANTNWIRGGTTYMQQLFAALPALKVGAGGPDQFPHPYAYPGGDIHNDTESDRVYTGEEGGTDYRGVIPYMNQNQDPSYGGKEGCYLPSEIYAQNVIYQQTHHAWKKMWVRTDSTNFDRTDMTFAQYVAATRWSTGILPYLRTNPAVTTTAPSSLGMVVTGG